MKKNVQEFLDKVSQRNPHEPEFLQAVHEVAETIIPFIEEKVPKSHVTRKNGRARTSSDV